MSEEITETKPVRIPSDLHTALKTEASSNGEKLGQLVERKLRGNSRDRRTARRKAAK